MATKRIEFSEGVLDLEQKLAYRHGVALDLRPKTFAVLCTLAAAAPRVVSKQELLDVVWSDVKVGEGVLAISIAEIRKSFGDSRTAPRVIETIWGRGYRFVGREPGSAEANTQPSGDPGLAKGEHPEAAATPSIAVLSLPAARPDSHDVEFASSVQDLLYSYLSARSGLHVMLARPEASMAARSGDRDFAQSLRVSHLAVPKLEEGDRFSIHIEIRDVYAARTVCELRFEGAPEELPPRLAEFASKVQDHLCPGRTTPSAPIQRTSNPAAQRAYMRGLALNKSFEGGNMIEAVGHLKKAVALAPDNFDMLLALASSLQAFDDAGARETIERALTNAANAEERARAECLLAEQQFFASASDLWETVQRVQPLAIACPNRSEILSFYGVVLIRSGVYGPGRALMERVVELNLHDGWYWLGNSHLGQGNLEWAIESYELALPTIDSLFFNLWFLTLARQAIGDFDGAADALRQAESAFGADVVLKDIAEINRRYHENEIGPLRAKVDESRARLPKIYEAYAYFMLQDWDAGFDALEAAAYLQPFTLLMTALHPEMRASIEEQPRYQGVLRQLGYGDEWVRRATEHLRPAASALQLEFD